MPTPTTALTTLRRDYDELASHPALELTADQRRGVGYYLVDVGRDSDPEDHVLRWITRVHSVEAFVARENRLPRADSHRPRAATDEQTLVDVLTYFRQVRGSYCDYQRRRLEAIPGFSWRPRADAWQMAFEAHQYFWAIHKRPPRRRSMDPTEVRLGRWVALQRTHARAGRLEPTREALLRSAPFRVL